MQDSSANPLHGFQTNITFPNGDTYTGFFKYGKKHGKGTLIDSSGNTYVGDFRDDLLSGNIKVQFNSGYKFDGVWKDGTPYGIGTYLTPKNIRFDNFFTDISSNMVPYDYKLAFIHIPKTGGTDFVQSFIPTVATEADFVIQKPIGHNFSHNDTPSFSILREPVSRFISAFKFSRKNNDEVTDINIFLESKTDDEVIQNFLFKPQSQWLRNNTYVVKYDPSNNYLNVLPMLKKEFGVDFTLDLSDYKKKNVSSSNNLNCVLTDSNIARITALYQQDVDYYNKLVALNVPYCKISELL